MNVFELTERKKELEKEIKSIDLDIKKIQELCEHKDVGRIREKDIHELRSYTWCRCHDCSKTWYE